MWYIFSQKLQNGISVYHGTDNDFDISDFCPVNKSINSTTFGDVDTERHGIFLSDNRDFAGQYGKNTHDIAVDIKNPAKLTEELKYKFINTLNPFTEERDLWLLAKHLKHDWGFFEGELGEKFVEFLKNEGYDGAVFPEDYSNPNGEEFLGNTYVAFAPSQIQSQ